MQSFTLTVCIIYTNFQMYVHLFYLVHVSDSTHLRVSDSTHLRVSDSTHLQCQVPVINSPGSDTVRHHVHVQAPWQQVYGCLLHRHVSLIVITHSRIINNVIDFICSILLRTDYRLKWITTNIYPTDIRAYIHAQYNDIHLCLCFINENNNNCISSYISRLTHFNTSVASIVYTFL